MPRLIRFLASPKPNGDLGITSHDLYRGVTEAGELEFLAMSVPLVLSGQLGVFLPVNALVLCTTVLSTIMGDHVELDPIPTSLKSVEVILHRDDGLTPIYATINAKFALFATPTEAAMVCSLGKYANQIFTKGSNYGQRQIQIHTLVVLKEYLTKALPEAFRTSGSNHSASARQHMIRNSMLLGDFWGQDIPNETLANYASDIVEALSRYLKLAKAGT